MTADTSALYGTFHGELVTVWLTSAREDRRMRVHPDTTLAFERPNGEVITMTVGREFDGQSIPPLAWPLVGSPMTGKSRLCAAIHDELCARKDRPYRDAHRVMYEAMRSRGMRFRAALIYRALLMGGSKW
jgi:hypothetical protein